MLRRVWGLTILIFAIFICSNVRAQQGPPDGLFKFFNKMAPQQIANINSCYYNGQVWVFYEKMSFFPESFSEGEQAGAPSWKGKTYFVVWDGKTWSKEKEFNNKVFAVLSDSKRIIAVVDGGYKVYSGANWSGINAIKGLSNGFACLSSKGIYLFYNKDGNLVYRILDGDTLGEENVLATKWEFNRGTPSFMNMSYSRAVYAYDKVWLFYSKQSKEGSALFYRVLSENQLGDETFLINTMQYSPVVRNGEIYLFYVNWMPPDPANMSMSTAFKSMMRTNYMIFDGVKWSGINYVQTGQTMLVDSLCINRDLWLFIGAMASINYLELTNGTWSKIKSISKTSPEMMFVFKGFALNFIFFIFFSIIVWQVSKNIEIKKKVVLTIAQKQYQCASLFRRYIAHTIDFVVFYLIWMIAGRGMISPEGDVLFDNFWAMWSVMFFGYFLGGLLYFVILEGRWGKTLGKLIMKVKVISENGEPCGFKKALIRNILRIADGFLGYLVGAIIFGKSEKHQRLGDYAGKTFVILDR